MEVNLPIVQIYSTEIDKDKPIVFFDRDGVITENLEFLLRTKDISFYKRALKALKILSENKFTIVIVTNQPAIARGWISVKEIKKINDRITDLLKKEGILVHAVYSCPHHPNANVAKYKLECSCRKPGNLSLKMAADFFRISLSNCFLIGDRTSDIKAGNDSGTTTFLLNTGYGGKDKKYQSLPSYRSKSQLSAVKKIIEICKDK